MKRRVRPATSFASVFRFRVEKGQQIRQGNPQAHTDGDQRQDLYRSSVIRTVGPQENGKAHSGDEQGKENETLLHSRPRLGATHFSLSLGIRVLDLGRDLRGLAEQGRDATELLRRDGNRILGRLTSEELGVKKSRPRCCGTIGSKHPDIRSQS
jgi:hypothetical protein